MKVLQVCNLPSFIKQHLRRHIDHLASLGFTVESVCPDDIEIDELRREGYVVHTLPIDRSIDLISNYKCIVNLVKLIKKNRNCHSNFRNRMHILPLFFDSCFFVNL
jgi:hypothetical protein